MSSFHKQRHIEVLVLGKQEGEQNLGSDLRQLHQSICRAQACRVTEVNPSRGRKQVQIPNKAEK